MNLTSTELYVISMVVIVAGSALVGFLVGKQIGYARGLTEASENILDADLIGDFEHAEHYPLSTVHSPTKEADL